MSRVARFLLIGSLGLALSACALFGDEEPMYTSGTIEESVATVTAKVAAIDHVSRSVSLLTNDGRSINFQAGPQVENLAQVEAGDLVRVTYYESVAYNLVKPEEAIGGIEVVEGAARAEAGEKPGAGVARMLTVTAKVIAIDEKVPTVSFETSTGERRTVRVRNPDRLKGVRVGDLVDFTYTQALAIGVEEIEP